MTNRPVIFNDPTGHKEACGEDTGVECKHADSILTELGITTKGLKNKQKWSAAAGAAVAGLKFYTEYGDKAGYTSPIDAFRKTHGEVLIQSRKESGCETVDGVISCGGNARYLTAFLHEFGHVFENYQISIGNNKASDLDYYKDSEGNPIDDGGGYWSRTTYGFMCGDWDCLEHPPSLDSNQTDGNAKAEQFADLYLNWALDGIGGPNHGFTNNSKGDARRKNMSEQQIPWVLGLR